jgi:hypothetical protein
MCADRDWCDRRRHLGMRMTRTSLRLCVDDIELGLSSSLKSIGEPMKLCRLDDDRLGLITPDQKSVADASSALAKLTGSLWPRRNSDALIDQLDRLRPLIEEQAGERPWRPLSTVSVKSPISCPSKLIEALVNYRGSYR